MHRRIGLALLARAHSFELDRQLAAGASPQLSELLAARAAQITGRRSRQRIADGLARTVASSQTSRPGFTAAARPRARDVLAARTVIASIDRRLRGSEPVAAHGVAILRLLLTDCTSPLYLPAEAGELGSRLRAAAAALEPPGQRADPTPGAPVPARDEALPWLDS